MLLTRDKILFNVSYCFLGLHKIRFQVQLSSTTFFGHEHRQPPEMSYEKKCSLKFCKITGKHLCQSHFIKKVTLTQVFFCEFCEIFKKVFFIEHIRITASAWIRLPNFNIYENTSMTSVLWTLGKERRSRPEDFCKKGTFRNFAIFTGLQTFNFIKKRPLQSDFM